MKKFTVKPVVIGWVLLILTWEVLSRIADNKLLFPELIDILKGAEKIVFSLKGITSILNTLKTAISSFGTSFILAGIIGTLAIKYRNIGHIIDPFILFIKSLPTVGVILLIMIWSNIETVPFIVGIMISVGTLYDALCESIQSIDKGILNMCKVYRIPLLRKIRDVYIPWIYFSISPIIPSVFSLVLKVVIAGEILSQLDNTIGGELYYEKNQFNTEIFFAWLILTVILVIFIEKILKWLERRRNSWKRES